MGAVLTSLAVRCVPQRRLPLTDAHAGRRAGIDSVRLRPETLAGLMRDPVPGKGWITGLP